MTAPAEDRIDTTLGVYTEATKLLDWLDDEATSNLVDLPTRQYVTMGQAVWDCEQVSATISSVGTGIPGSSTPGGNVLVNCPLPWQTVVELAIVRCFPVPADDGTPPSVNQLLSASQVQSRDSYILQRVAELRASDVMSLDGVMASVMFPPPSGGLAATVCRYTVAVST